VQIRRTIQGALAAALAAAIGAAAPAAPAHAAPFTPSVYYLDVPSGAHSVFVSAINNTGTIVGGVNGRAVKWNATSGAMTYLPPVDGYVVTGASDVNDSGVVVGYGAKTEFSEIRRPIRWNTAGAPTKLSPNDGFGATAISSDGHIAGWSGAAYGPRSPVRFVNNQPEHLTGSPGNGYTAGVANGGIVAGHFQGYMCAECRPHAFVQTRGQDPVMLPTVDDQPSTAAEISTDGRRVAGTVNDQAVTWSLVSLPFLGDTWMQSTIGPFRAGWETFTTAMSPSGGVLAGNATSGDNDRAWAQLFGVFVELPGGQADAVDVNDAGVAVGYLKPDGSAKRPVVWR
jgi:uncharacterized membrane protein